MAGAPPPPVAQGSILPRVFAHAPVLATTDMMDPEKVTIWICRVRKETASQGIIVYTTGPVANFPAGTSPENHRIAKLFLLNAIQDPDWRGMIAVAADNANGGNANGCQLWETITQNLLQGRDFQEVILVCIDNLTWEPHESILTFYARFTLLVSETNPVLSHERKCAIYSSKIWSEYESIVNIADNQGINNFPQYATRVNSGIQRMDHRSRMRDRGNANHPNTLLTDSPPEYPPIPPDFSPY